jgi:hypothetical protein
MANSSKPGPVTKLVIFCSSIAEDEHRGQGDPLRPGEAGWRFTSTTEVRVPGVGHVPRVQLAEQERDPGRPPIAFLNASRLL